MLVRYKTFPSYINEIEELLNSVSPITNHSSFVHSMHGIDIKDTGDSLKVVVELPGIAKEDVTVSLHDSVLTVVGERKKIELKENEQWLRNEIRYGKLERSVKLPYAIVSEKITATQENGLLRIEMPKAEEAKPKQIVIK